MVKYWSNLDFEIFESPINYFKPKLPVQAKLQYFCMFLIFSQRMILNTTTKLLHRLSGLKIM